MTPFTEIYDLFLIIAQDYNLDGLDQADLLVALQGFLVLAISNFDYSKTSLDYTLGTTPQFDNDLTNKEKMILAYLMAVEWLRRIINDLKKMDANLQSADFKTYSESNNLREKIKAVNDLIEETERRINRMNWASDDFEDLLNAGL